MYSSTLSSTSTLDWGGRVTPSRGRYTPGDRDPVPIVQVTCAPGPLWTDAANLAPTGIRCPERTARGESLHPLPIPTHRSPGTKPITISRLYPISGVVLYQ